MTVRTIQLLIIALVLVAFGLTLALYAQLPLQMASHWNIQGQVDDYLPKFWGAFLLPIVMAAVALLLAVLPNIDPLKANILQFRQHYFGFIAVLSVFLLAVHTQLLLWNIGVEISPNTTMPVLLAGLVFYLGIACQHAKRNWFFGIRTPWTLSSDEVWEKTHQLGGKLFKLSAVIALGAVFFPSYAFVIAIAPLVGVSLFTLVYSYFVFRKLGSGTPPLR